jgi:hypothetical protein
VRLAKQASAALAGKRYDAAKADLRTAYALCPEARLRHAMGCVAEASGALPDALASFRACFAEATDDDLRAECRSRTAALDDRLKPPAPAPKPAVAAPAPVAPAQPVAAGPAPVLKPTPPVEPPREVAAAERPSAAWNWVGIAGGVALIGTGVGFLGQYGKDRSDAHTSSWVDSQGYTHDPDTVKPTYAIVGGMAAGVGVAILITSAVLWPKAPATVSASPVLGGGGMVSFGGSW